MTVPYFLAKIIEHWNDGDDPPDIMAYFEKGNMGFEITRFLPKEIGKYNHLVRKAGGDSTVTKSASLTSTNFKSNQEMINEAFTHSGGWASVEEEKEAWIEQGWTMFMEKADRAKRAQIDCVIMIQNELCFLSSLKPVIAGLQNKMDQSKELLPSLLIHWQLGNRRFYSWLIKKGEHTRCLTQTL